MPAPWPWQQTLSGAAIISAAPGNGARTWIAAALGCWLQADEPAQAIVIGPTAGDARAFLEARLDPLQPRIRTWRRVSNTNEAYRASRTGRRVTAYACRTSRPLEADLIIGIDVGAWPANAAARVLSATATAPRRILIGQRPAKPDHPFALAIAAAGDDVELHAADPEGDPFDPVSWRAANPSLEHAPGLADAIGREAEAARTSPLALQAFRAGRLNAGDDAQTAGKVCRPADWRAVEHDVLPPRDGQPCIGFDLGSCASMTAAVALWPTGRLDWWARFPATPDLATRGAEDGVGLLYADAAAAGELTTSPGRTVDVGRFLADVLDDVAAVPRVIGADRYRRGEAETAIRTTDYRGPIAWRGVGAGPDGAHDVEAFQRLILARQVRTAPSLLFASALAEARLEYANGNPRIDKSRKRGRIDLVQAAVIASGLHVLASVAPPPVVYHGAIRPPARLQ